MAAIAIVVSAHCPLVAHLPQSHKSGDDGCYGVSPSGVRWVYAMPQHTGSASVAPYLHTIGIGTCHHVHSFSTFGARYAFSFVANPFRRMLSAAAWAKIIDGGKVQHNRTQAENVRNFRRWIADCAWVDKKVGGVGSNGAAAGIAATSCTPPEHLVSQKEMFDQFERKGAPVRFVGRTANLSRDLQEVLHVLGYNVSVRMSHVHCVANCPSTQRMVSRDALEQSIQGRAQIQWYDHAAAQRVLELYARDFDAFGFSRSPASMYS
jgi:hypothetical protein